MKTILICSSPKKSSSVIVMNAWIQLKQSSCVVLVVWREIRSDSNEFWDLIRSWKRSLQFDNIGVPEGGGRRALAWRLLLGYLPTKQQLWLEVVREKRAVYTQLVREMIVTGPEDKSPEVEDHPLNPHPTSQWQSFFRDNEVANWGRLE